MDKSISDEAVYCQNDRRFLGIWSIATVTSHEQHRPISKVSWHEHRGISNSTVCLTGCSAYHERKHQISQLLTLCEGNPRVTGGFPSQMASNARNISMSWSSCVEKNFVRINPAITKKIRLTTSRWPLLNIWVYSIDVVTYACCIIWFETCSTIVVADDLAPNIHVV